MGISFSAALMPFHLSGYENVVSRENTAIGSIISLHRHPPSGQKDVPSLQERLRELSDKIRERIDRSESVRRPKNFLILRLIGMFVFFATAQAAMAVVEQGGIVNCLCPAAYWIHLWYILGRCCIL
jgi:hypothetical protein